MKTITSNRINPIFIIILLGLMVLQISCVKKEASILYGTVWRGQTWINNCISTLTFQEGTFTITNICSDSSSDIDTSATGIYIYDHPKITLEAPGLSIEGKISGNKINIVHYSRYGGVPEIADTYTKQ